MSYYKVAKNEKSEGVSKHFSIRAARKSRDKHEKGYHIYKVNTNMMTADGKTLWEEVE